MKSCVIGEIPKIPHDKDMIVSYWSSILKPQSHLFNHGEFQNWYIYARPRSPIVWEIIERVVHNIFSIYEQPYLQNIYNSICLNETKSKAIVLTTTGPIALSLTILNSQYRDTVLISNTINSSLRYMCQDDNVDNKHYSFLTEPLITPNEHGIYIPKTMFTIIDSNDLEPKLHSKIVGLETKIFYKQHVTKFLSDFFGNYVSLKYNTATDATFRKNLCMLCILYVYGGCIIDETNFKSNMIDFSLPNTWYIGIDETKELYIITPPNNIIILEIITLLANSLLFNINIVNNTIQKYVEQPLKIGKNVQTNGWACILLAWD